MTPSANVPSAENLPAGPGTYLLFFRTTHELTITAGRLGDVHLKPGLLSYIGSAHGPGGLRARVGRHLRGDGRPHWHVDALRAALPVAAVWLVESGERLECNWAGIIAEQPGVAVPAKGFGSSDCACPAHLFALPEAAPPTLWTALSRPTVLGELFHLRSDS